ncbi:MAG: DUF721 domain-containing protein [Pseudomonadota bacterium]
MANKGANGKSDGDGSAAERPRTGKPFHRPSKAAHGRLRAIAQNKGFAELDVLLRWAEAVGPQLAGICQPVKVSYSGAIGATLLVRTDSGHAPRVEHSKLHIIDRINSFYGYRAISRIAITQATGLRGFAEGQAAFDPAPNVAATPSSGAVARAADLTKEIKDPDLRAAVTRMGAWVLSKPHKSPTDQETS